ncbi:hypothetical protein [Kitasatospora sp. NPDC057223]|uniref:hypothetical protein n=1 Tax=Kitasatospora sp. NPDC057223 TaxID=3346055 RepID=UPI0036412365
MINGIDRGQRLLAQEGDRRRTIDVESWAAAGVPLLRDPREFVTELHRRHLPQPGTVVVTVLNALHRVTASASFVPRPHQSDGWQHRNAILAQLRQVTPHELRRAAPAGTAVLLRCREGAAGWTEQDGAWMWALRDAAALHGLRCGSYLALTPTGWQILGDGRSGRSPHSGSWAAGPVHTVTELPPRPSRAARQAAQEAARDAGRPEPRSPERAWAPSAVAPAETARRAAGH